MICISAGCINQNRVYVYHPSGEKEGNSVVILCINLCLSGALSLSFLHVRHLCTSDVTD